jgi:uncharacterized protein YbbC (DUF1343 family)
MTTAPFLHGIDVLVRDHADWLRGRRVGLIAHPASVGASGQASAQLVQSVPEAELTCLFGPEHGYTGAAGAGDAVADAAHPGLDLPVFSLYGAARKPTPEMLSRVDTIVFDLQDLGVRCYTYISTLRLVLEACAEHGKTLVVADRPSPLARVVDGPMLDPRFESFVGCIPAPVVCGLTPGETAGWLRSALGFDADVRVARMQGYGRETIRPADWPAWVPPSPAIPTWESGQCFPVTVALEALPALDHGRGTDAPFQRVGAPWLDANAVVRALDSAALPGVRHQREDYTAARGAYAGSRVQGLRIRVVNPSALLPVLTGVAIIRAVQELHGHRRVWDHPGTCEGFFDQLVGTDRVRRALKDGRAAAEIAAEWAEDVTAYRAERDRFLLYAAS